MKMNVQTLAWLMLAIALVFMMAYQAEAAPTTPETEIVEPHCILCGPDECDPCYSKDPNGVCRPIFGCVP
ncbi:hypothetical protein SK128_022836 [Halocaridina rubra]|uniref:Uncharacterized protein n=1 Tax=Halocaridina rubra TaxID=373956 RepID=A0AAN8WMX3_HALRR